LVQVKKDGVRQSILRAAFRHFSKSGYSRTTVSRIAAAAGVSPATVYVYFRSKLQIFLEAYASWLHGMLDRLERELASLDAPAARLRRLFAFLWMDVPAANGGFANNLVQALATAGPAEGYSNAGLRAIRQRMEAMMRSCLGDNGSSVDMDQVSLLMFAAFDGFTLGYPLNPDARCAGATVDAACRWLVGSAAPAAPPARGSRRTRR
jgi:AcrR family transcriptional regulator